MIPGVYRDALLSVEADGQQRVAVNFQPLVQAGVNCKRQLVTNRRPQRVNCRPQRGDYTQAAGSSRNNSNSTVETSRRKRSSKDTNRPSPHSDNGNLRNIHCGIHQKIRREIHLGIRQRIRCRVRLPDELILIHGR